MKKEQASTWNGMLGWLASFYPHCKIPYQKAATLISKDPEQALDIAHTWLTLIRKKRPILNYQPVQETKMELRVFADASYFRETMTAHAGI